MLSLTVTFLNYLSVVFNSNYESQTIVSLSWAGYIISKYASDQEIEVTSIEARWTVPQVNISSGDGYSSMWVGIGGQTDKSLIQLGTEHDSISGQEIYSTWYELLPNYAVKITSMQISPGDSIFASITLTDSYSHRWNMHLSDVSNGQTFNLQVVYNSTRSSGEWIIERPTISNQISTLANFGTVTFKDCRITVNGVEGVIGNFSNSRIQMTNQQATHLATISQLYPDNSSFAASYHI